MQTRNQRCQGLTLIELLGVIMIIGVLAALILPLGAKLRARSLYVRAQTEMASLVMAIKQYRLANAGIWPTQNATNTTDVTLTSYRPLLDLLTTNNPYRVFIELPAPAVSNAFYPDPWGRPYNITMDLDGNSTCTVACAAFGGTENTNVPVTVAVFSWGADPKDPKKRANSWK